MTELIRLKELLPDYYVSVVEMNKLLEVEQFQIDDLYYEIQRQQRNQFVLTADKDGISAWEQLVGISSDASLDLDTRRYNVLSTMLPPKPITIRYVQEILDLLNIDATLDVDYPNYHVSVNMRTSDQHAAKRLEKLLSGLLPSNLTFSSFNIQQTESYEETHVGMGALISTKYTTGSKEET